jgi:signal transduction histidine kinase
VHYNLEHLDAAAESTGVGLAVVKQLVEAQGGRVWVESKAGAGAVFRFAWPKRPRGADVNMMETRA